jgi:hypothetical protein
MSHTHPPSHLGMVLALAALAAAVALVVAVVVVLTLSAAFAPSLRRALAAVLDAVLDAAFEAVGRRWNPGVVRPRPPKAAGTAGGVRVETVNHGPRLNREGDSTASREGRG